MVNDVLKNYGIDFEGFSEKIMKDGAIPAKVKRLIAIASAVAVGCDYCVDRHVKLAYKEGISRDEIAEAILVASLSSDLAQGLDLSLQEMVNENTRVWQRWLWKECSRCFNR